MSPSQHKTARATFTRALHVICRSINEQPILWAKWTDPILKKDMKGTVRIQKIWAVGSWAQGVGRCGDLDLVVQHVKENGSPVPDYIMQHLIAKKVKNIRVYLGTPEDNTSYVSFPDPKLLWSQENRDWEKNILSVKTNPLASRQYRRTDDLPLRGEQVRLEQEQDLASLLDLRDQGIITWEWIEGNSLKPSAHTLHPTIRRRWEHLQGCSGKETSKSMQMIRPWLESDKVLQEQEVPIRRLSRTEFLIDSTFIRIGRPLASVKVLQKKLCEQLVLVPHWSRRGPNGLGLSVVGRIIQL